jgi:metallo-beta-lactamase family protein
VLVDCGLFQGLKLLRRRNWSPPPVAPESLDAVLLTHAHIDHSGYLPALVKAGFSGPVHCTPPTRSLCGILLPDSGHLNEEDAQYANRKRFSKHAPALPLYTEEDARDAVERLRSTPFGAELHVGDLTARFVPAGHILGAASVALRDAETSVLFSGDLGRSDDLLMRPPEPPGEPDFVVMESTYGDREHDDADPVAAIADVLQRTAARGGTLLIPSFAVGRAQTLLLCLHEAFERGLAPRVPVYVNSPMATDVTELYQHFADYHRLSRDACSAVCDVAEFVRGVDESKALAARRGPLVVISASGMATGGRVLHHLRALAPDRRNAILLPGYQAAGTRGASLAAGAESVKLHGAWVPVRAEVSQLDLLSAHADRDDLVRWLGSTRKRPRGVFLVHGEPTASDSLRREIEKRLGHEPHIPEQLETVDLRRS